MVKYKHPIEYVPTRIRLFFFFSAMAWVGLFKPKEGQEMIDLVKNGQDKRKSDAFIGMFDMISKKD